MHKCNQKYAFMNNNLEQKLVILWVDKIVMGKAQKTIHLQIL